MKKIFKKSNIFSFLLGALIFSGITGVVAATMLANDVSYSPKDTTLKVDNVKDAIDDLYTKAKPEYTGITTVTPTTSSQLLSTNNKILKSNITIEAIPSTYKNLTTTTTVNSGTVLNGYKAYTSDGTLITGTLSTDCFKSIYHHNANSQVNIPLSFTPTMFYISHNMPNGDTISLFYNGNIENDVYMYIKSTDKFSKTTDYSVSTNSIISTMDSSKGRYVYEYDAYYMACK